MDKIKFAKLISWLTQFMPHSLDEILIGDIDRMITEGMPQPKTIGVHASDINELLHLMAEGQYKIEAIKKYRTLTGAGLKESKDAVEKYWVSKPIADRPKMSAADEKELLKGLEPYSPMDGS